MNIFFLLPEERRRGIFDESQKIQRIKRKKIFIFFILPEERRYRKIF